MGTICAFFWINSFGNNAPDYFETQNGKNVIVRRLSTIFKISLLPRKGAYTLAARIDHDFENTFQMGFRESDFYDFTAPHLSEMMGCCVFPPSTSRPVPRFPKGLFD